VKVRASNSAQVGSTTVPFVFSFQLGAFSFPHKNYEDLAALIASEVRAR
jgi:hypothetical protein